MLKLMFNISEKRKQSNVPTIRLKVCEENNTVKPHYSWFCNSPNLLLMQ